MADVWTHGTFTVEAGREDDVESGETLLLQEVGLDG